MTCNITGAVRVWDVAAGSVLAGPFADAGRMTTVAVSPDGRRFMAGGVNADGKGVVRIWGMPKPRPRSADSNATRADTEPTVRMSPRNWC